MVRRLAWGLVLFIGIGFDLSARPVIAADYAATEQLYFEGQYEACMAVAAEEVAKNIWNDRWPQLLIRCQMTLGHYAEARETFEKSIKQFTSGSVGLRLLGYEVYRANNEPRLADEQLSRIEVAVSQSDVRFTSNENLVAIGRFLDLVGEDARKILELIYDRIRKNDPNFAEVYVASAELALNKYDYKVAAESLEKALALRPNDPYIAYLAAQAWMPSDEERAQVYLIRALTLNPRHVPAQLMVIDRMIDAEKYTEAKEKLTQVFGVNLAQPEAWAYHAVIAHLQGYSQAEKLFHAIAQERWRNHADVDYLIGLKLSQHYRFREGAEYQRRALVLDPKHRKAQFQLAQDLLRLGDEDAGWILASQVKQQDGYNVVAHNLMALKEVIDGFVTLQEGNLHVRMDARESRIYGRAVLDLLTEARDQLTAKYNIQIDKPVLVEIFPAQKDFAIRTFGLPGGAGFLGVCFGRVVTANSPASQGATPSNWQSVLWHEFCHVITLEKTRNKMPRWLSEGISVYEERQRDGTWGDAMSPEYRTMILGGDLTPVSELSSAFLSPKSPMHLQFAYYESSQVIDFWVKQYGFESLLGLLDDLGAGIPINDALTRRAGSLPELDAAFEGYIKDLATHYGEKASWERDESLAELSVQGLQEQLKETPNQYWALELLADQLVEQRDFAQAKQVLQQAIDLFDPRQVPERLLKSQATVLAELKDAENERATLVKLLDQSSDAIDAFERLTEVAQESQDWDLLGRTAQRLRAVNPLLPSVQTAAALAAEKLDQPATAAEALMALVELDPIDPAGVYYRLAAAEHQLKQTEAAKRHVLMALEEAPRYRAALELLLSINGKSDAANEAASAESSLDAKPAEEKPAEEKPADEKPDQVKADEAKGN